MTSPILPARLATSWMAAAALVYACSAAKLSAEPAMKEPAERAVTVARVKNVCFADTLQVTGVVTPRSEVLVRPDREGLQIAHVSVEPGDTVVTGQVLARLVPPDGQPGAGVPFRAPAGGTIVSTAATVGTTASGRGPPLFRIAARGEMELLAEAPVNDLGTLAPDQEAKVEIVGVGELQGKVRLISTAINPMTQLGQVRVFIGNDPKLRVGAFGRAKIEIAERCGPAVPLSAVLYGPGGAIVQTVRDGRVETRRVTVGLIAAGQAEIREGLAESDTIVARAGAFLREGDRVRAVAANEPAEQQ